VPVDSVVNADVNTKLVSVFINTTAAAAAVKVPKVG
jgi:hypothetical protein